MPAHHSDNHVRFRPVLIAFWCIDFDCRDVFFAQIRGATAHMAKGTAAHGFLTTRPDGRCRYTLEPYTDVSTAISAEDRKLFWLQTFLSML